jgi:predicted alpha-1,6-mannanase (GH76 family)
MAIRRCWAAAAVLCAGLGCSDDPPTPSPYRTQADQAMAALSIMWLPGPGRFELLWWHSAVALEGTIDYSRLTGSDEHLGIISGTFDANVDSENRDFLNDYYDDEGWWALSWLKAWDLTGEERYLDAARLIFDDMTGGWDEICDGGVWWRKQRDYKNAITNELFMLVAARLHLATGEAEYLEWAERTWAWLDASGMINGDDLVNDGLTGQCVNNEQTTWSYNQGVILGGLVALHEIRGDDDYLSRARAIADAAIAALAADGVLVEPCEPDCGGDGPQFKGIFMRNLSVLHQATDEPAYADFIAAQADSIGANATSQYGEIGLSWGGPFDLPDTPRQSAGVAAINAALALPIP